jgi:hypothetical protein
LCGEAERLLRRAANSDKPPPKSGKPIRSRAPTLAAKGNELMIGPTIVFLCAVSLVAIYMSIVNHLLRTDENWSESNQIKPSTKQPPSALPIPRFAAA